MADSATSTNFIYFFGNGQADGGSALKRFVGGKGASLADMTKAGFNVPPGFTISAECCQLYFQNQQQWPAGLQDQVRAGVARLEALSGRTFGQHDDPLVVAVRSGAAESMPGMMDTVLNVGSWEQLIDAINAVFNSWNNDRALAYRRHHQIEGLLGTAVTVQMMCPAEISGVMFTADPVSLNRNRILIEAAYGLGEALVLGKVTPDRFLLDKETDSLIERTLQKPNGQASLDENQLRELIDLGKRVENYFQVPCDIEWALSRGQFYLLQSRPIKGFLNKTPLTPIPSPPEAGGEGRKSDPVELEKVRREEIEALATKADLEGTVWSRYNLAEILPSPTPMTWAIVRRFMSGQGGFGLMYRDLGFDPDPALDEEGIFDLVAGRPYCNLSREPRMQYRHLPFEHSFAALKTNPARALYPQPSLNPARASIRFWLTIPWLTLKLFHSSIKLAQMSRTFADKLRQEIFPAFAAETDREMTQGISKFDSPSLIERLDFWIRRTLIDFARDSLKPTVLAGVAMGNLERGLRQLGPERTRAALGELSLGVHPDPEADLPGALRDLANGRIERAEFLKRFGHRGSQEMELSQPRWAERPESLEFVMGQRPARASQLMGLETSPFERIATEAKLTPSQRANLEKELQALHTYLGLRETAKHYLMKGYALIRRILVELDRHNQLNGGIFFLVPEELPRLVAGEDFLTAIAERHRRRELLLTLEVPQVLFSDDLEAIGRPASQVTAESLDTLQGVPLSAGVAEGPALVLTDPTSIPETKEPYVLVCPTTDPAWVPLFVNARGLVMETGGVLSHGAIVARECGLPAVAGLPDIHRRLKTGQRIRVDGATGKVFILKDSKLVT
jgi:pyruvate,water dikinase